MKKWVSAFVCCSILMGLLSHGAIADAEHNHEIDDPEDDILLLGLFGAGPLMNRLFSYIDIVSGGFYEYPDEPDLLYATMTLKEYRPGVLMVAYGIFWYHDDISYGANAIMIHGEDYMAGLQIQETMFTPVDNFYTINKETHTITFAIPKSLAGTLEPGDTLLRPFAVGAVRFVSDILAQLFDRLIGTNILAADLTLEGKDYTIQY